MKPLALVDRARGCARPRRLEGGELDRAGIEAVEAKQGSGRSVTHHGVGTKTQDACEELDPPTRWCATDGVHPRRHAPKCAPDNPSSNKRRFGADFGELRERDQPELVGGDVGDAGIQVHARLSASLSALWKITDLDQKTMWEIVFWSRSAISSARNGSGARNRSA